MKTKPNFFNKLVTFFVVISLSGQSVAFAQAPQQDDKLRIGYNDATGKVSFIGADPSKPITIRSAQIQGLTADSSARAMIAPYAADFGLKNPVSELKLISADQVEGREVTRFQQVYKGIPIMGGEMIVNSTDEAELLSLSGEISPDLTLDTNPALSPKQAQLTALESMAKSHQVSKDVFEATEPELWIYDLRLLEPDGTKATLVWRLEVKSKDSILPINELVLVDAKRGAIVLNFNQIDTAWATGKAGAGVSPSSPNQDDPPTDIPTATVTVTPTPEVTTTPVVANTEISFATPTPVVTATPIVPITHIQPHQSQNLAQQAATNYFVNTSTGNDSNSCTSVAAPCQHIQETINKAGNGSTIRVANGTYAFSTNPSPNVLIIDKNLSISGGWDSAFIQQESASTLDGTNTNNVVLVNSGTVVIENFIIQNGKSSNGGGIYNYTGNLTLTNTTIKSNTASGNGGGIFLHNGTLTVINSTISNNSSGINGGGIYGMLNTNATTTIKNSTVAYNTAKNGGGISQNIGSFTILNSIVANNTGTTSAPDCNGMIAMASYSIIEDPSGCTITTASNNLNVDPQIDSNLTETFLVHKLLPNSPAIDSGNPNLVNCPSKDQLGHVRPQASGCDIGAIESGMKTIFISSGSNQTAFINTAFAQPLVVYVQDENYSPVNGVQVTFTAPISEASGIFSSTNTKTITVMTNASGIATTSTFTANNIGGTNNVIVSVAGYTSTQFELYNRLGIWYVSTTGNNSNSCSTPTSPCASIVEVLGKARFVPGDSIKISTGVYDHFANNINKDVNISGGWNSSFTSQIGQSTIDGQNLLRAVAVSPGTTVSLDRFVLKNGYASQGAGIYNQGYLTLTNSAVVNNITFNNGGGIYQASGSLTVKNTTISNNYAKSSGGGVYIYDGSSSFKNVTITQNFAQDADGIPAIGGGLSNYFNKPVAISNSIIAGNVAREMPDCRGNFTSGGNNLIGYPGGCTLSAASGDLLGISGVPLNAKLGNLADNGSGTLTHALLNESPAINAGNPSTCETEDQRGIARPQGPTCDMGAFEGSASQTIYGVIRTYTTNNGTTLPGTFLCDQTSPACTNGSNLDADKAHQFALGIYQFYASKHNRQSVDSNNMPIISTVHYDVVSYHNAFWDGAQMVYGEGYSTADDVVGHELTHGVTQYESNLFYYYQSGAINESFSDVWGELYDQQNGLGNDAVNVKWLHGEDLPGGANRSMSNPPVYGDPDKMTSANYYLTSGDSGGVHHNSGINNKAAYLMVDGGSFNGKKVTAIGADKTLAIYYEVQTNLLTSGADYADLYNALYQGCLNLVGGSSGIVSGDCQQVRKATDAVEMNLQPVAISHTESPLCGVAGQIPNHTFYDDLESGTSNWTIVNGGTTRWQYGSPYGVYAHSGTNFLFADDYPAVISDTYIQLKPITIPSNGYLDFTHAYDFEKYSMDPSYYDGGVLEYSKNGGSTWLDASPLIGVNGYVGTISSAYNNPLKGRFAFVGTSHGYINTRLNLASLAGQSVIFRWRMGLDESGSRWGWWLDDVQVYECGGRTRPYVVSSLPANANPTNATNVNFTVTFSDPVTGINTSAPFSNFMLTTTGVSGASITAVTGSGATRTVTVNSGTGSGTIRLNIVDDDTILDVLSKPLGGTGLGNGNFASGGSYTIDKTVPIVSSITRIGGNPAAAASANFTVTFSESVSGVDIGDFTLISTGVVGVTISSVSGSGATRAVKVNTGTGDGTISLNLVDDNTIVDSASNPLGGAGAGNGDFTGETYIIDKRDLPAPILRSPQTKAIITNNLPSFWWTHVQGAQSYEIQFAQDNSFTVNVNSEIVSGSPYTIGLPLNDATYYWRVRAYGADNKSGSWSSFRILTIDTTAPPVPVLSSPADNSSARRTAIFKWQSNAGSTYQFQYDNNADFSSPNYTVTVRGNFRRPPAMKIGTYYWRVRAKDSAGNLSAWSAPFTINITGR